MHIQGVDIFVATSRFRRIRKFILFTRSYFTKIGELEIFHRQKKSLLKLKFERLIIIS